MKPLQEHVYLEMDGNDDGQGEDEDLAVVHRVVHIRPVSGAENSNFLPSSHLLLRQSCYKSFLMRTPQASKAQWSIILASIKMPAAIQNAANIAKIPIVKISVVWISSISSIVHIHWGRQTFPEPHSRTLKMIVYQNKWVKVEAFQILQYQMCCGGGFISVSQEVAK